MARDRLSPQHTETADGSRILWHGWRCPSCRKRVTISQLGELKSGWNLEDAR